MKKFNIFFVIIFLNITFIQSNERLAYLNIFIGENFIQNAKIGIISFNTTPQIAFWLESEDRSYKKTIYITKKFAKQEWDGVIYDKNKIFREYSLPAWVSRFKNELPTKNNPLSDSITMASPKKDTKIQFTFPIDKKIILFLEVNNSFDYNKYYPKDKTYNGQPSLIYTGMIEPNFKGTLELKLSYKTDFSGKMLSDLSDITTAKNILKRVEIIIK